MKLLIRSLLIELTMNEKENIILTKSYAFALEIVKTYKDIVSTHKEFVLSKQLLRSGTSVGANVEEAVGGVTKKDFRAKMGIAYKEARETSYWLRLLKDTEFISSEKFKRLHDQCDEVLKILFKIIQNSV